MTVTRGGLPADNFTMIPNDWLRDARLSWKAKGLLAYIASHRAGYRLTRDQIVAEAADGRDSALAGLRELEEVGYLTRIKERGEGGRIEGTRYLLGEAVSGKPVDGSDQDEHDVSAGRNQGGKSGDGEPAGKKTIPKNTREKTNSSATPRRGTRLPDDFTVTAEMRSWYVENIGGAINGPAEHEKFMDYWRAAAGAKGVKLDWIATWRNWMRTALDRSGRGARPVSGAPAGASTKPRFPTAAERSQQQRDEWTELAKEADAIVTANGGDPNDHKLVLKVMEEIKAARANGSASRTSMPYSEDQYIDGEVVTFKEVTAGEGA